MTFRNLRENEIEARVSRIAFGRCYVLLYKNSRVDMDLLDETVGAMNWKRGHTRDNANCIVSIWDKDKGQWVTKEDTGTESKTEAEKGLASDSFKRACVNWGIGRELYTAPVIYFEKGEFTEKDGKTYDRFEVEEIIYDGKCIHRVTVRDIKTGVVKTFGNAGDIKKRTGEAITEKEAEKLGEEIAESQYSTRSVLAHYHVRSIAELTTKEAEEIRGKILGDNGKAD